MREIISKYKKKYEWDELLFVFSRPGYICLNYDKIHQQIIFICHTATHLLFPVMVYHKNVLYKDKIKFLSLTNQYMKKLLMKIKILYYKNIPFVSYRPYDMCVLLQEQIVDLWKRVEKCIVMMDYAKSGIFFFLEKKVGHDVNRHILGCIDNNF